MRRSTGPERLSRALSELISLRGWSQQQGVVQLQAVWRDVAGEAVSAKTQLLGLKRGVLEIAVENAALLSELCSFHRENLLERLQAHSSDVRGLRFRLRSSAGP